VPKPTSHPNDHEIRVPSKVLSKSAISMYGLREGFRMWDGVLMILVDECPRKSRPGNALQYFVGCVLVLRPS
jgi:hypothetical protein